MRKTATLGLTLVALSTAPLTAQRSAVPAPPGVGRGDSAGSDTRSKLPGDGAGLYRAICQSCHMADARGGTGAGTIPALAANPRLADPAYPMMMVVQGRGAMPGFIDTLSPIQIAEVVRYVCTHFGNACKGDISPDLVRQMSATVPHRPAP
jgi:mono/diheme cytochrome c family protein